MEQRERSLVQPLIKTCVRPTRFQKPARFSSISSRFAERDVPISASPSSFSAFRPAFLPSSSTPLRFIQPSSDCSHIVRTPLVSSTHTHFLLLPLDEIFARLPGDGRNREMNVRARWGEFISRLLVLFLRTFSESLPFT